MNRSVLKPGKPLERRTQIRRGPKSFAYSRRRDARPPEAQGLKRDPKKALGTAKPEEGSRRDLEQKLESSRAKEVKMRDGYRCRQCVFDGAPTLGPVDAGHIYPKGKFPGGKFLIENLAAQCRTHNTRHVSRPEFMFIWLESEHGEGSLEKLHALVLSMPRKMTLEWLREQIEASESAIAEMELLAVA